MTSTRDFDRHMKRAHVVVIDETARTLVTSLRDRELEDYANVIVAHVDKTLPNSLCPHATPNRGSALLDTESGNVGTPNVGHFFGCGNAQCFLLCPQI